MLLTGTNIHESQQALKLARRYPIVGRRLASIPMTAVSGHLRLKTPLLRWRTSRKSSLSVSAGWISIAIFPRRRSRSVPFRRSYKLPPNCRCQSLCTAGTRMSDFWHCLIHWLDSLHGAILHCFTGSRQQMQACVDRGLYIGITGWVCDERRGLELRELLPFIPAEKLLIETDAPYLLPRDLTPKPTSRRNEPAYLPSHPGAHSAMAW